MSAGVPAYQRLQYTLNNASSTPNILLTHTAFDGELVISRQDMQFINESQVLYISSNYSLYSDGLRQTTWSGFKLDDLMTPLILFSVVRTTSYGIGYSVVPFEKVLINVGQRWNTCNNQFFVPRSGMYVLALSSASVPNATHSLYKRINDINMARMLIYGGNFDGIDISSHVLLLPLNADDLVKIFLFSSGPVYSDDNYQTAFSGFLYEPVYGQSVTWCLSFPFDAAIYLYGPPSVNFTTILLNNGEAWNANLALLQISMSRTYYLQLSGYSYPTTYKFNLILSINS